MKQAEMVWAYKSKERKLVKILEKLNIDKKKNG